MKNILSLVGGVFFLLGCNVDKGKKVDAEQLDFKTTDRSEIFFKNMRQSSYITKEEPEAGVYIYTHSAWEEDTLSPVVPSIVFNWRMDRAYLMLNWSERWADASAVTLVIENDTIPTVEQPYYHGNMVDQLAFSVGVYNALMDGSELAISSGNISGPMFISEQKREAFRITMYDYLRLTGWF